MLLCATQRAPIYSVDVRNREMPESDMYHFNGHNHQVYLYLKEVSYVEEKRKGNIALNTMQMRSNWL